MTADTTALFIRVYFPQTAKKKKKNYKKFGNSATKSKTSSLSKT